MTHEFLNALKENGCEYFFTFSLPNIPEIAEGDNLAEIIVSSAKLLGGLKTRDIIVVASKIVSKSEGLVVDLSKVAITEEAKILSGKSGKSPDICQVIIDESKYYAVNARGIIIAHHNEGFVITSAGVDRLDESHVAIIPRNPDASAKKTREQIENLTGTEIALIITDSEGREDRAGAGVITLGASGIDPIRKSLSPSGKHQEETLSDLVAGAGSVLMGQRGKNTPIAVIRGYNFERDTQSGMKNYLK